MTERPTFTSFGCTTIEVLPELLQQPLNDIAWCYIEALRPSSVRISTGRIKLDSRDWRVTIYLYPDTQLIRKIEQEVQVGGTYGSGYALQNELRKQKEERS